MNELIWTEIWFYKIYSSFCDDRRLRCRPPQHRRHLVIDEVGDFLPSLSPKDTRSLSGVSLNSHKTAHDNFRRNVMLQEKGSKSNNLTRFTIAIAYSRTLWGERPVFELRNNCHEAVTPSALHGRFSRTEVTVVPRRGPPNWAADKRSKLWLVMSIERSKDYQSAIHTICDKQQL